MISDLHKAARRWWTSVAHRPNRLRANLAAAPSDARCLQFAAVLTLALAIWKALLNEGLPWLALRGLAVAATQQALALLAARRPAAFAAWREPLVLLVKLHAMLMTIDGALHGGTNILEGHRGSPVLLLALLLVYNGGLWLHIFSLVADLPLELNAAALPLLAAVPALASPALCRRLLEAPGAAEPLASLYAALGLLHSVMTPLSIMALHTEDPGPQCLVVSNWSLTAVGVAAPLIIQRRLQWRHARTRTPAVLALQAHPPPVRWVLTLAGSTVVWCALLAVG